MNKRRPHRGYIHLEDEEPCPACTEESRLSILGLSFSKDSEPLRKPSQRTGKPRRSTDGCEVCYGSGRIVVRVANIPGFRPRTSAPGR